MYDNADVDVTGEPTAGPAIPGLDAWLAAQSRTAHESLRALACLLNNIPPVPKDRDAHQEFVASCLGVDSAKSLVKETRDLLGTSAVMVGLALAELLDVHQPLLGPPGFHPTSETEWATVTVGPDDHHVVVQVAAHFAGTAVAGLTSSWPYTPTGVRSPTGSSCRCRDVPAINTTPAGCWKRSCSGPTP